ncbi:MAG: hypothetical protein JO174_22205 [Herbaspirillum sp.]|nr:hypothetical protein [Herbaspirillum sp.]
MRPLADKYPLPSHAERDVVGPQDEMEQSLQALIHEAIDAGPAIDVGIDEVARKLRERIHNKR